MAKTPIDKLSDAITDILEEYAENVEDNVGEIADKMAEKGAKALRAQSRQKLNQHTGDYAKGWKAEKNGKKHRLLKKPSVIYNDHYSLPHLLEWGHVTRNGTARDYGSVPGREHIKPVADKLVETFEREVVSRL